MATIATYSDLLAQIGTYLARSDHTAQAPVWVTLAQNKINRLIKSTAMETESITFSITGAEVAVPSGFIEAKSFFVNSTNPIYPLQFMPIDEMISRFSSDTGKPKYFSVYGTKFRFGPVPDATYTATLIYYTAPGTLSSPSSETNTLFPTHADMYLYAALLEATAQTGDDPRIPIWQAAFAECVAEVNKQSNRTRWGGNLMAQRPG